jgi:hypothetical protein
MLGMTAGKSAAGAGVEDKGAEEGRRMSLDEGTPSSFLTMFSVLRLSEPELTLSPSIRKFFSVWRTSWRINCSVEEETL